MTSRLPAGLASIALAAGCAAPPPARSAGPRALEPRPVAGVPGWEGGGRPLVVELPRLAHSERPEPARADAPAPLVDDGATTPPETPALPPLDARAVPDGAGCLERLVALGVAHSVAEATRGVRTPVVVKGPLGGLRWRSGAGPMLADCRLVVVLASLGPALAELGVREVRFSGAYSYRMSRAGRLSLHAYGLAVDVHELRDAGGWRSVERDFTRGAGVACGPDSPLPNRVACLLRARGPFRELLTPDYDAAHRDHLHVSIAPLPTPEEPHDPVTAAALARGRASASVSRARRTTPDPEAKSRPKAASPPRRSPGSKPAPAPPPPKPTPKRPPKPSPERVRSAT